MAVVRCPIHKIPYNDENPRGCPACHRERLGADREEIMRQLVRATGRPPSAPARPARGERPGPRPADAERPPRRWWWVGGIAAVALLAGAVVLASRPRFVDSPDPPAPAANPRTLPIEPGTPMSVVFAILGTQAPIPHPVAPRLARYRYGADLVVDAYNDSVYAFTFSVHERSWRGLQVGMPERQARGALALIGTPEEIGAPAFRAPLVVSGYAVYRSADARPVRRLRAAARPPNGCFDVPVTLQPRARGILAADGRRYAVVGRENTELEWVATEVQVVSRAVEGPYAEGVAC